jgi:hypothetical protein
MSAAPISVKAGTSASGTLSLNSTSGTGRVYLSCVTTSPSATCAINSGDTLNQHTVDFSNHASGTAALSVTTSPGTAGVPENKGGIYAVEVTAYTVSNEGGIPDSEITIPLTIK